jgi:hypothetical protein
MRSFLLCLLSGYSISVVLLTVVLLNGLLGVCPIYDLNLKVCLNSMCRQIGRQQEAGSLRVKLCCQSVQIIVLWCWHANTCVRALLMRCCR